MDKTQCEGCDFYRSGFSNPRCYKYHVGIAAVEKCTDAKFKPLTEKDVEFSVECYPEDITIEGNASAIDDETDEKVIQWIKSELESGNEWAWCRVEVRAVWEGIEGVDHLGGCSYRSRENFMEPNGYYDDMKAVALGELNREVKRLFELVNSR